MSQKRNRDEITKPIRLPTAQEPEPVSLSPLPAPDQIPREDETAAGREEVTGVWQGHRPPTAPADPDQQIIADRYRVLEHLGQGGMACIYKVEHVNLGKIFALKLVDRQSDAAKRIEQLFFREARVASIMDHPNIVGVTDFGVDEKRGVYLVMEYLQGETLHARLRRELAKHHSLSISSALEIGLQTAEALHYMHSQNVIHCDIKSENVFLCTREAEHRKRTLVKLIDFGLSRTVASGLTLAKAEVAGTPEYMAPELLKGHAPQPSMDIYSLGVLFYEMLTGRLPFAGTTRDVINDQLHTTAAPPSDALEAPLDERLEAFVMRTLHKDPIARHESMGRVIFELRTLLEMLDLPGGLRTRGRPDYRPQESGQPHFQGCFDQCPFPIFQLDRTGRIVTANQAFLHFVSIQKREMIGRLIDTTRLAYVYPNIAQDLKIAIQRRRRSPIQRVLSFSQPDGKRIPMMSWLTPEADDTGRIVRFYGYIHPLQD